MVGSSTPVPGAARGCSIGCRFAHFSTGACHGYTPAGCMGGCSSTWLPGCRLCNIMTASVHSLCAGSLGHHSHPPVTQNDINQSKFSPRWKWAAPGQEGAPDNHWDADGEEIQGAAEAFSQLSEGERSFGLQLRKSRLSARGMEKPAAIQAEELNAKCWCSHAGNQLGVKGKGRLLGFPRKCLSRLLWCSACCCGQFSGVETSLPQKLGDQELEE